MNLLKALKSLYTIKIYYNMVYKIKKYIFVFTQLLPIVFLATYFVLYLVTGKINVDDAIFYIIVIFIINIIEIVFFNYRRVAISYYVGMNNVKLRSTFLLIIICSLTLVIQSIFLLAFFIIFTDTSILKVSLSLVVCMLILLKTFALKTLNVGQMETFYLNLIYTVLLIVLMSSYTQLVLVAIDGWVHLSKLVLLFIGYWVIFAIYVFVRKESNYDGISFINSTIRSISFDVENSMQNNMLVEYTSEIKRGLNLILPKTCIWQVFHILFYKNGVNYLVDGTFDYTNNISLIDNNTLNNQRILIGESVSKFQLIVNMINSTKHVVVLNIPVDDFTDEEYNILIKISENNKVIVLSEGKRLLKHAMIWK